MRYQIKRNDTGEVILDIPFTTKEAAMPDISKCLADHKLTDDETIGEFVPEAGDEGINLPATQVSKVNPTKPRKVRKDRGQPRGKQQVPTPATGPAKKVRIRNRGVYFASTYMTICPTFADLIVYLDSQTEDARKLVRIGQGIELRAERQYKLKASEG